MFGNVFIDIGLFLVVGVIFIFLFSRLGNKQDKYECDENFEEDDEDIEIADAFPKDIQNVPGHEFLFFSYETRFVYKMYEEDDIEFLEPFVFNNHLCKYINGRIMEVVQDRIIAIVHTACLPK